MQQCTMDGVVKNGITWKYGGKCDAPTNVSKGQKTILKPNAKSLFVTHLSLFLAFVPMEFRKMLVYESTRYGTTTAKEKDRRIKVISVKELMSFGILLKMLLNPIPGCQYTAYWLHCKDDFTAKMALYRFLEVQSALHMSNNDQDPGNDAQFKVRTLLMVLKKSLSVYIIPGSEAALDESSAAARSSYGRELIFFNPTNWVENITFPFTSFVIATTSSACE